MYYISHLVTTKPKTIVDSKAKIRGISAYHTENHQFKGHSKTVEKK